MKLGAKNTLTMKKIYTYAAIVALCATAVSSCQKEASIVAPDTDTTIYKVKLSNPRTKAFTDAAGLTWNVGDQIRWEGNTGNTTHTLTAEEISSDGHTATFEIAIPNIKNESPKGVFRYNYNSANNSEWNFGSSERIVTDESIAFVNGQSVTYTQSVAGTMNPAFIFLHSSTKWETFAKSESETPELTASMQILGSIFRVMPYTTEYNDESIQSVSIKVNDNSKRLGGLVFYNYGGNEYLDANQKNYNSYTTATVNLGTALSLSGITDRESSKGIYFAVPATNTAISGGYTVVIKTDVATYTYNSSADLSVSENAVKNIYIKLDAAHRVADADVKGTLKYEGSLRSSYSYDDKAQNNIDLGWWFASTTDSAEGSTATTRENRNEDVIFYTGIQFSIIDDATGTTADWLSVQYQENNTHWILNVNANTTGVNRQATITATFPNAVSGYILESGYATKTVKISQTRALGEDDIIGELSYVQNSSIGNAYTYGASTSYNDLGWLLITTRNTGESGWTGREAGEGNNDALYYSGITFSVTDDATGEAATWCRVNRPTGNTRWYVTLDENKGTTARTATITATFPTFSNHYQLVTGEASTKTVKITQNAPANYTTELWNSASLVKTYYCANWDTPLTPNATLSTDGKTLTSVIPTGIGGIEWMGQNFIVSDVVMQSGKEYKFSCKINATATGTCTIKLALWNNSNNTEADGIIYDNNVVVTAGTTLNYERSIPATVNGNFPVVLIVDLGRSAAGSTWTFSDISIMSN